VFFVDGNESARSASFAEERAFRASWRRSRWDLAQE